MPKHSLKHAVKSGTLEDYINHQPQNMTWRNAPSKAYGHKKRSIQLCTLPPARRAARAGAACSVARSRQQCLCVSTLR